MIGLGCRGLSRTRVMVTGLDNTFGLWKPYCSEDRNGEVLFAEGCDPESEFLLHIRFLEQ